MKKLFIITISLCFLFGCAKPLSLTEQGQLNTLPIGSLVYHSDKYKDWKAPPVPENAVFVHAKIIKVHDYSDHAGRMDMSATWPHLHLELEIIEGILPIKNKEKIKNIDYHLDLHSTRNFQIGQNLTFIFTRDGQFYGVKELKPIQELEEDPIEIKL